MTAKPLQNPFGEKHTCVICNGLSRKPSPCFECCENASKRTPHDIWWTFSGEEETDEPTKIGAPTNVQMAEGNTPWYVNVSAFEKVLEQFSKEETATWLQWHYEDNKIRVYEKVTELAGERNSLKLLGYDFKKRKEVDFQGHKHRNVTTDVIAKYFGIAFRGHCILMKSKCFYCGKMVPKLEKGELGGNCEKDENHQKYDLCFCSKCRSVGYCSKDCQKHDWSLHKKICPEYWTPKYRYHAKTGIVFDERMLKHQKKGHPERPERLVSIKEKLTNHKLYEKCIEIPARRVTNEELYLTHSKKAVKTVRGSEGKPDVVHFDNDTYANCYSSEAAELACGGLIDLAMNVWEGKLDNGFACIRPPGHHAGARGPMGFCLYNNVAVAVNALRAKGAKKIAIVDWDVHHGNGTQDIFEDCPDVLFFSLHRYGNGFYPGTGAPKETGKGQGEGYTCNIGFQKTGMGSPDYITALAAVVAPMIQKFEPEILFISAGFDCGEGDRLGKMLVSSEGFALMLHGLQKSIPSGKVVCALEGGYYLDATSEGVASCVRVLLGEIPAIPNIVCHVHPVAAYDILTTIKVHKKKWDCFSPGITKLLEDATKISTNIAEFENMTI